MNKKNCPICKNNTFKLYKTIDSYIEQIPEGLDRKRQVNVTIYKCFQCNLFKTEDLNLNIKLKDLYKEESVSFDASFSKLKNNSSSTLTTDELKLICKKPPAKLLEIGCGAGHLLQRAHLQGYEVLGIDIDTKAIKFIKEELNLNVLNTDLYSLNIDTKFDVIVLIGVFEHIEEPNDLIKRIKRFLKEDGEIILGLPNVFSFNRLVAYFSKNEWDMFLEPGHIFHYQKSNLVRIFNENGMKLSEFKTASTKIRGKIPFLPNRNKIIETKIKKAVEKYPIAKVIYLSMLKLIDIFRMGDIILAKFKFKSL